jgi:hypothetical protein
MSITTIKEEIGDFIEQKEESKPPLSLMHQLLKLLEI